MKPKPIIEPPILSVDPAEEGWHPARPALDLWRVLIAEKADPRKLRQVTLEQYRAACEWVIHFKGKLIVGPFPDRANCLFAGHWITPRVN